MKWLLLGCLLVACRAPEIHSEYSTPTVNAELQSRAEVYASLAPRGWAIEEDCDALLFVTLQHIALGERAPLQEAEPSPGRWLRKPEGLSCSSDISRDMLIGLMSYAWEFGERQWLEDLFNYGKSHTWQMGAERKPPNNRTVLTPNLIGLLARMIYAMGGPDYWERHLPTEYSAAPGYVSHLTLLQIRLEGQIRGGLTGEELETLQRISTHMATNPLVHALYHRYTDGDQTRATELLLTQWPADRLPTSADWCGHWRNQLSDGERGMTPCPDEGRVHAGGDFLFAAREVLRVQ